MKHLDLKTILKFWIPLSATWLMMSVEGPYLAAIIARMAQPKFNLAAYGVAFSFAMIVEAPIIMIMSASTALVKDYHSFKKLKTFTYLLNTIITCLIVLFILPPVFNFIAGKVVKLPDEILGLTHIATIILIPWPASIGYRRFYQGILISHNLTKRVAYGTIVRLSSMSLTAIIFFFFTNFPGVIVGASALSCGVICEAIASKFMALATVKQISNVNKQDPISSLKDSSSLQASRLSYREIIHFYYPLALTSILTLAVNPMITFFLGQSRLAIESLAVLPVLNSFLFIFKSFSVSYQEAAIALLSGGKQNSYKSVRNFAAIIGLLTASILLVISLSPFSDLWFSGLSGLSEELSRLARFPLLILAIIPALEVLISFQRAVLINSRFTNPITMATAIEVLGIILVLIVSVKFFDLIGVTAAAFAMLFGRLGANIFLFVPLSKALKSSLKPQPEQ
jgi:Na+-driven multidrug efflux pump